MTDPHKFLIIRLSSLGDIIHTLPAFHGLRAAFPDARIDWLVEHRMAFLLGAVDGISGVLPLDTCAVRAGIGRPGAWRPLLQTIREMRARRYDVAVDFQGLLKTGFLSLLSGAGTRIGFSRPLVREWPAHWFYHQTAAPPESLMHVVRLNLLLARMAGAGPGEPRVNLKASAADTQVIERRLLEEQLSDIVVINPGGGWPTKRWPAPLYAALADKIRKELQFRVVVATGPGEAGLYQEIVARCTWAPAHFHIPFLQLIPLFQRAKLVVAGDTGPLHLACALGTPVVAIMGPTIPGRNGPWFQGDEIVVRRLPCSFCNRRKCPTAMECMDISVEEVFAGVARRLERTK